MTKHCWPIWCGVFGGEIVASFTSAAPLSGFFRYKSPTRPVISALTSHSLRAAASSFARDAGSATAQSLQEKPCLLHPSAHFNNNALFVPRVLYLRNWCAVSFRDPGVPLQKQSNERGKALSLLWELIHTRDKATREDLFFFFRRTSHNSR